MEKRKSSIANHYAKSTWRIAEDSEVLRISSNLFHQWIDLKKSKPLAGFSVAGDRTYSEAHHPHREFVVLGIETGKDLTQGPASAVVGQRLCVGRRIEILDSMDRAAVYEQHAVIFLVRDDA